MEVSKAPALPWAAGCVAGASTATVLSAPPAAWILFALCALVWIRRPRGRFGIAFGIASAALAASPSPEALEAVDRNRPVRAQATVAGTPWPDDRGAVRVAVRLHELVQGDRRWFPEGLAYVRIQAAGDGDLRGLERGARVGLRGYWGRPAAVRNFRPQGPGRWRLAVPSPRFVERLGAATAARKSLNVGRSYLQGSASRWNDQDAAALVSALWLGDAHNLPIRWRRALRATGLAHLLVVSGLHVGAVAALLWLATAAGQALTSAVGWRSWRSGRLVRVAVTFVGVVGYALLVGPRPSVERAAWMAGVALVALGLQRPPAAVNALSVAVVVLMTLDPRVVTELGFQLSVAATAGILFFSDRVAGPAGSAGPRWPLAVGASVAAQLAVAPFAAPAFALVHPVSPWLQLLALPWLLVTLGLGGAALVLGVAAPGLDPSPALAPCTVWLDALADLHTLGPGGLPLTGWPVAAFGAGAWTLVGAVGGVLLLAPTWLPGLRRRFSELSAGTGTAEGSRRFQSVGVFGVAVCGLLALGSLFFRVFAAPGGAAGAPQPPGEDDAQVVALDVGQGDALLLRSRALNVLVDGGGWRRGDIASKVLVPALADLGVRRLDAVVLTHPDTDHCAGLLDLTAYLQIAEVWTAPGWGAGCAGHLVGRRGIQLRPFWRGRRLVGGPWVIEALWPPPAHRPKDGDDNAGSLVLRAEAFGRSILLTGDIDTAVEARLDPSRLAASVLKVAHHGSKSSTSPIFLRRVDPKLALVQAGADNFYGHPHPTVLGRLRGRRIQILRTDRHGAVSVTWGELGPMRRWVSGIP
ncbi:MAG: ComEC/Rec2 family competence protein [Acidobacteriota bacterium]